jgi:hypothetical protein
MGIVQKERKAIPSRKGGKRGSLIRRGNAAAATWNGRDRPGKEEKNMGKVVIEFSDAEKMRIEAILMDADADEALRFFKEVIKPKLRAKGSSALDSSKSTGVMP